MGRKKKPINFIAIKFQCGNCGHEFEVSNHDLLFSSGKVKADEHIVGYWLTLSVACPNCNKNESIDIYN